ncbi:DNA-binding IclR family transcriptional regulator [Sphingomonas vulcanisoli]|uniref:DNA-binding IclR family transcriptional regulator n=1 Tax=Sphingomonas vulcanisoli TaxID=1658060 RepID=A0ABX0TSI2_9SPHN|nr:IclR family transcriptional regulator [Sphingomonas vulcanisoli]NIJ08482.1 DNA-binding IclR family transcriptional regulator [Sphingomonas vulcanisoli]
MKPALDGSVKSVKRALDVLELLAEAPDAPSFIELMTRLGIPRSSLFHLMGQLILRGYVEETPSENRYRLGRMPGIIAGRAARRTWLTESVRPVIRALSDRTNEFTAFYVVEDDMARGVAVESGTHALSYRIAPNHVAPLYAFAAGKVALAEMDQNALDAYLARVELKAFTANTITDPDALRAATAIVRETGLGRSNSEFAIGVAGFAMAVHAAGALVGIISVSVPEPRLDGRHEHLVTQCLSDAVEQLEARLDSGEGPGASPDQIALG